MAKKKIQSIYLCAGKIYLKNDGDYSFRTEEVTLEKMREKINNKKIKLIPLLKIEEVPVFNKTLRKRFSAIETPEGEEEKVIIDLEPNDMSLSINIKDLNSIYESIKHEIPEEELLKMKVTYRVTQRIK